MSLFHRHRWVCVETHPLTVSKGGHDDTGRWYGAGQVVTQAVYRCRGPKGCGRIEQRLVPGTWDVAGLGGGRC